MIRKQIHLLNRKMTAVHPIRAINKQLVRGQFLHVGANFTHPVNRHVHVAPYRTGELIAALIGENGRVFGIGQVRVSVDVREKCVNVGFEGRYDGVVCVELLDEGAGGVGGLGEVEACPAEEIIFPAVIVVLGCQSLLN